MVRFKQFPCCGGLDLQNYNHKGPHQKCAICLLVIFIATVVEKTIVFILRVGQEPNKLSDKLVNHCQIEWSEIVIKGIVDKLLINWEKVSVYVGSWGSWSRNKIQPIFYYLNIGAISRLFAHLRGATSRFLVLKLSAAQISNSWLLAPYLLIGHLLVSVAGRWSVVLPYGAALSLVLGVLVLRCYASVIIIGGHIFSI